MEQYGNVTPSSELVMFKKRKLFLSIGLRNGVIGLSIVAICAQIIRFAPWHSPLWCASALGLYLAFYWTYSCNVSVYYGSSWNLIKHKALRPMPSSATPPPTSLRKQNANVMRFPFTTKDNTAFIQNTLRSIPTLKGKGYKPTFYLDNPFVQTMYASALRADPKVSYDRELVTNLYADGEVCILDWSFSSVANDGWTSVTPPTRDPTSPSYCRHKKSPAPVVILFHGLTGGSDDSNMHYTTRILNQYGFHVVIPVRRGCADVVNLISRNKSYPYGDEEDTAHVVNYISKKMEGHWLVGVGLSAGSNVLCMYLGTQGANSKLKAAVSVANGYCWNSGTEVIVANKFYSTLMMSLIQYNLFRRHDYQLFVQKTFGENQQITSNENLQHNENEAHSKNQPHSLVTVVETHDLNEIRASANGRAGSPLTFDPASPTSTSEHPFVNALIESSAAAKRLVARSVTRTVVAADQLLSDDQDSDESGHQDVDSDQDESPTTTPFPFFFNEREQKKRKKTKLAFPSSSLKNLVQTKPDYTDYSHFEFHRIKSTTAVDGKQRSENLSSEETMDAAFTKACRNGIRGALNESYKNEQDKALALAASSALMYTSSQKCESEKLQEQAALDVIAFKAHQRHQMLRRNTRGTESVVIKDHYEHVREYDELVSRRLHGYKDLDAFYDAQSCKHVIKNITVPTFFLNALDDPVASAEVIPYYEIANNPNTVLITTARGGHLGWADGVCPFGVKYHTWLERFILEVLLCVKREVDCGRL